MKMSGQNKGKFSEKHPPGTKVDPQLAEAVKQRMHDGKISCAAAHKIAVDMSISPSEVGIAIDLLEGKLEKCQLGLFGYLPEKKVVQPAEEIPADLRGAIEKRIQDGKLSCRAAWDIAEQLSIGKLNVAAACEFLNIKIKPCQLGAF